MEKMIIRTSTIILLLKSLAVVIISDIVFVIISVISNYVEGASSVKFLSIIEYNTLASLIVIIMESLILIIIMLSWYKETYDIEKKLITHRKGMIFKKNTIIHLDSVETTNYKETFWGKIFNYGDIEIIQSRNGNYKLSTIDQPKLILKIINKGLTE